MDCVNLISLREYILCYTVHIKSHDIVNQHLCNTCGKIFHTLEHLEEHVRHYHTKMYPCVQCDKTYSSAGDLNRHLKIHKYESYSCEYCTKTFTRLDNLKSFLGWQLSAFRVFQRS